MEGIQKPTWRAQRDWEGSIAAVGLSAENPSHVRLQHGRQRLSQWPRLRHLGAYNISSDSLLLVYTISPVGQLAKSCQTRCDWRQVAFTQSCFLWLSPSGSARTQAEGPSRPGEVCPECRGLRRLTVTDCYVVSSPALGVSPTISHNLNSLVRCA